MEKKFCISAFLSAVIIVSTVLSISFASPGLTITIQADKQKYNLGETVEINGTLTLDDIPVPDALVALQIIDVYDSTLIFRTLDTGTVPQTSWAVEILSVIPCNQEGTPKSSFIRGATAHFKVTVRNNSPETKYVVLTLNCYYEPQACTFKATNFFLGSIPVGQLTLISPIAIPNNAPLGDASVFACAYTNLPQNAGYPYCPEKSNVFSITATGDGAGQTTAQTEIQSSTPGTYNLTFQLPCGIRLGNYTAYASTRYSAQQALFYTVFDVILLGDINDDLIVDVFDAVRLSGAAGSEPGDDNWNPKCDLNDDNIVDVFDAVILSANTGKYAIP